MEELLQLFNNGKEAEMNIQPYVATSWLFPAALGLSFILLLVALRFISGARLKFFEPFFSFVFSENYALSFFKYKQKIQGVDVVLALFFVLQLTILLFNYGFQLPYLPKVEWIQFVALFLALTFFFLFKFWVYSSLRSLLPSKVKVKYYGFNYAYWCFYFGLFLFLVNLLVKSGTLQLSWQIGLFLILLFYSFLIFRFISISLRYSILRSVYIFLYFCALEIAPIAILSIGFMRFLT